MDSAILGVLNVTAIAVALSGRTRLAAWIYIAIQPIWCWWDCETHNYGFLIIGAGSVAVSVRTLLKLCHETARTISERIDTKEGSK